MSVQVPDMTPPADPASHPGGGARRLRRPVYVDLLPPCNHACPAGENIQAWLSLAQAGRTLEAWQALVRDNPFPAVHGRVCYHPCETACNRGRLDTAVSVHAIERFLGDRAVEARWPLVEAAPASGRRVLIIGAGPCGLSAAWQLARCGHAVEVRDAAALPGGMLQFGIPAYRLPRQILAAEIARLGALGVTLKPNHRVTDVLAEQEQGHFDAVLIAIGAGVGRRIEIPTRDAPRVLDAVSLLHAVGEGERPRLGRRVLVYGGGDTAMDAARTVRRLGAEDTLIVYRRDRQHMPAHAFELGEATEEGIQVKWLRSVQAMVGSHITVEVMQLDAYGRPQPTGRFEILDADAIVLALGQSRESDWLRAVPGVELADNGSVLVGDDMMTGHAGLFAGGDLVPGEASASRAVGDGRRAARSIDAWLRGRPASLPCSKRDPVSFDMLHLPVYSDAESRQQTVLPVTQRLQGFDEVVAGLSDAEARYEAQRCLSCGNCYECDGCYAACPERAIGKVGTGQGYRVDLARCTGCAVCFEQCPCHAIEMVAEP
jgi:NADPH-dependent glutamate synthase beta subunit-like oxidoreductase